MAKSKPSMSMLLLAFLILAGCQSTVPVLPGKNPEAVQAQRDFIAESFAGVDVTRDPGAAEDFRRGLRQSVSAAWWGFDPEDATESLQAAFDSGAAIILIPAMGRPWNTRPLFPRSHSTIILQEGAELWAKKGSFRGTDDCLLSLRGLHEVTLSGYGARLLMRKNDYRNEPYSRSEYRHAIELSGCTRISLLGLRVESSGGDGIYLGRGEQPYNADVLLRDLQVLDNYRQAISVISAQDLTIENVEMSSTEGTLPSAGIDFEPNYADERFVRCTLRHCVIRSNTGPGICLALRCLDESSPQVDISVKDSYVSNNMFSLLVFGAGKARGRLDLLGVDLRGIRLVWPGTGVSISEN
jgi:hypothetical protein